MVLSRPLQLNPAPFVYRRRCGSLRPGPPPPEKHGDMCHVSQIPAGCHGSQGPARLFTGGVVASCALGLRRPRNMVTCAMYHKSPQGAMVHKVPQGAHVSWSTMGCCGWLVVHGARDPWTTQRTPKPPLCTTRHRANRGACAPCTTNHQHQHLQ